MKALSVVLSIGLGVFLITFSLATQGMHPAESVLGGLLVGHGIGTLMFDH